MRPNNYYSHLVVLFLVVAMPLVHCHERSASYESIYFIDSNTQHQSWSNLTCKDEMHPCAYTNQIILAAMNELSNIISDNSTRLDSFTMIIKVLSSALNCAEKPFDFSQYTKTFNLFFIRSSVPFYFCKPDSESIINELGYVGAVDFVKPTISFSRNSAFLEIQNRHSKGIEKLIIDQCEFTYLMGIDRAISNFTIRNSIISGLIIEKDVDNMSITNSTMGSFIIRKGPDIASIKIIRIEIDNCFLTTSFLLSEFDQFIIRNSVWKESYLSKFNYGSLITISNTSIDSPCIFISISRIIFDNILISNVNYGNYFHQFILVEDLSILNSRFSNTTIPASKYLFSLKLVLDFTLKNCNYEVNVGGGFIYITDTSNDEQLTNNYSFLTSKFTNNLLADTSIFYVSGLDDNFFVIANNLEFFNNTSGNENSRGSCFEIFGDVYIMFTNLTFISNRAVLGGAIHIASTSSIPSYIKDSIFSNNSATLGGAIFTSTPLAHIIEMENTKCDGNFAFNAGGCIYVDAYSKEIEGLKLSNNTALWYGNDFASPLKEIKIVDLRDSSNHNSVNAYQMYAGEIVMWHVYILDMINQSASFVNHLTISQYGGSEDATISQSIEKGDSFIIVRFQILPKTSVKIIGISLSVNSFQQVLKRSLQVEILECPFSYSLKESDSGYLCTYVPLDIIIPTAIFGLISLLITLGFTTYGIIFIIKKLLKLRKQEKAEYEIDKKMNDKDFIFETEPLLSKISNTSINSNQKNLSYIIPISEINIIKRIGEGGMGVVYHAQWNRTDVAIKKIKNNDDDQEEFERESILMSSLRHPSIVSCYGVSLTSKEKYIVVEYMENGSLEKAIYDSKQGRNILRFSTKLKILIGIAKGMTYLHTIKPHKIIHRDLKPANVLLDNNMNAKVGDFGLSKIVSGVSMTMTCNVGTLFYSSPEVLSDKQHKGQSTKLDVYSFSILMWEILFEIAPFSNETIDSPFAILTRVVKGNRPTLLYGRQFESVTDDWIQHNFTKKQIENSLGRDKIIEILIHFVKLMEECWSSDPSQRPEFIQITEILQNLTKQLKNN